MYKIKGRPFSSTSTTAFFGSRVHPQGKDYRMNPKVAMYQTDGFGRDTYIKEPNGGFRKSWSNIHIPSCSICSIYWKFGNNIT